MTIAPSVKSGTTAQLRQILRVTSPVWMLGAAIAGALTLAGCAPEPGSTADAGNNGTEDTSAKTVEASGLDADESGDRGEQTEPHTHVEDCNWDSDAVTTVAAAPGSQKGDLRTVIVGAWQHTAIDHGSGFEPLGIQDIRYVFPSPDRLLYCQHIPGVLEHLHNAADISWDGTRIVVPGGAPGFEVLEWNDSTMVWTNHMDGTTYLLQRR